MKGFIREFQQFAMKGNVVDLAVGIIIGAAFGAVVTSLVNDVIMPPIGYLLNGVDFSNLGFTLKDASAPGAKDAVVLSYGKFINAIISFTVIAFAVFLLVKAMNEAKKRFEKEKEAAPEAPSKSEVLLTEIRDLLKK